MNCCAEPCLSDLADLLTHVVNAVASLHDRVQELTSLVESLHQNLDRVFDEDEVPEDCPEWLDEVCAFEGEEPPK